MSHFEITWVKWTHDKSGEWVYDLDKRMTATLAQADVFVRNSLQDSETVHYKNVFVKECKGPIPIGYLL